MNAVLEIHERIYDHIQNWSVCHWMDRASHDEYVIYCVSKDTIQDTAETLLTHRQQGFSENLHARYFEYYGILQATYLQPDAIWALHRLFIGREPDLSTNPSWSRLRGLRNGTVGHPVGRRRFLNRNAIGYNRVNYSWWPEGDRYPKSEDVALGALLDDYEAEATLVLIAIFEELERSCATKHS